MISIHLYHDNDQKYVVDFKEPSIEMMNKIIDKEWIQFIKINDVRSIDEYFHSKFFNMIANAECYWKYFGNNRLAIAYFWLFTHHIEVFCSLLRETKNLKIIIK